MIETKGFRKENLEPFFNQVALSVPPDQRQATPFLVWDGGTLRKCDTLQSLLKYEDNAEVLQTWPGKVRSDVFYFLVKDLRTHYQKGGN